MTGTERRTPRRTRLALALAGPLLAGPVLAGCGAGGGDRATLTVFAAASLAAPLEQLAERFEADHQGTQVRLSLAGSADLVAQVRQGAPADVVATADEATMDRLVGAGLVREPVVVATNTLTIAVPPGNPAGVGSLEDLAAASDLALVVCAPQVPCGAATDRLARAAGLTLEPASEEQSVTDVLGKVASGEADAGLVYVTDVRAAAGTVEGVTVPEAAGVVNRYPVAPVSGAGPLAEEFVALLLSPEGRATLDAAGFGRP
jgi:molybdate transport system substrate-binding protein